MAFLAEGDQRDYRTACKATRRQRIPDGPREGGAIQGGTIVSGREREPGRRL